MSLRKYLENNKINEYEIPKYHEFTEIRYNAVQTYCENCGYIISSTDLEEIKNCGLEKEYKEWKQIYVVSLWEEFGDVPMNPETEEIEEEWHGFPAGTFREDIWHWFEETFNVSVTGDLMRL